MKVFVTGGTGFVGNVVVNVLLGQDHEVTILTRSPPRGQPHANRVAYLEGDPRRPGRWQESLAEHEGVINLAGASIFCRWTRANKRAIRESRINTTRNLVEGLSGRKGRETVLISASGTGYYGFREEEGVREDASAGRDFLAVLSQEWEAEARRAAEYGARVSLCRLGVVLGRNGGALKKMAPAFRAGLGSPLGNGNQWFSWIHEKDLANIFLFLLSRKDASGPVNCTAPQPVRNRELTSALGRALRRPTFLPSLPGPLLKMALGEFAEVFLEGQCAVPARLLDLGFVFRFPTLADALNDLL
ncbi:MAG: TIGR01777 family oxidoreductase [Thermodesulfobacteriota bacterium]